jgi:hypothetical protein
MARMALGEVYPQQVRTRSGVRFRLGLVACNPVSDMAALEEVPAQQTGSQLPGIEPPREKAGNGWGPSVSKATRWPAFC